jgi:hypothetical protein
MDLTSTNLSRYMGHNCPNFMAQYLLGKIVLPSEPLYLKSFNVFLHEERYLELEFIEQLIAMRRFEEWT